MSGRQSPSPSSREQVIVHQEIPLAKVPLSLIMLMLMFTPFCNLQSDHHFFTCRSIYPCLFTSLFLQPEEEEDEEERTEFTVEHLGPVDEPR